ncbi:TRAP transporter small permease subunit [Litoreibacter roseus]|uniref:TRAP transporter small permease protein n=1 Tax=Litoreibacter roseus TaxID=2601869 RepID=A0A6N6JEA1_9RHOB|nr:TRAP transporter small permease subunit [Litoreibacter roseus]GFE64160.1 C4-dicarboxylate ABC transporter [Litoreibacter roseus]
MLSIVRGFIAVIDAINYRIGRIVMYGIFVLMGILLWSSVSKTFFLPSLWTLEMAQFAMVAYYILGGPYSIQMGSNVRMDLLYGGWSLLRKAWFDLLTVLFLMFYLAVLLFGALSSTAYSLGYWGGAPLSFFAGLLTGAEEVGRMEQSSSAWRPYLWPIKAIMITGIFLMLLQCLSELLKDVLRLKGETV